MRQGLGRDTVEWLVTTLLGALPPFARLDRWAANLTWRGRLTWAIFATLIGTGASLLAKRMIPQDPSSG